MNNDEEYLNVFTLFCIIIHLFILFNKKYYPIVLFILFYCVES